MMKQLRDYSRHIFGYQDHDLFESMISEVVVTPIKPKPDGHVGYLSFIYRNELYFGNIAIIRRSDGSFRLLYPAKKIDAGYLECFHPISRDVTGLINEAVLSKIEAVFN